MPFILLIFSLCFISCKKQNPLSEERAYSAFDNKSFMSFYHGEGKLKLRKNLLNAVVDPTQMPVVSDEVEFKKELNSNELKEYSEKEKGGTKLIISYTENIEVYFVPTNIPVAAIIDQLKLTPEVDRKWKWLNLKSDRTQAGVTLYLLSLNHADLMKNDQEFYAETFDFKNEYASKVIKTTANKKVEIFLSTEFFIQGQDVQTFGGRSPRCPPGSMESGGCEPCTFKRIVPASRYEKKQLEHLNDLGLVLKMNGQVFQLGQMPAESVSSGVFRILVDVSKISSEKEIEIELVQQASKVYTIQAVAYGHSRLCVGPSINRAENFYTRANINVSLKIWGRGDGLRKLIL